MIYFKEYTDYEFGDAVAKLNEDIKNTKDKLVKTQYQVVRYEAQNIERTYILAQWKKWMRGK